MHIFIITRSALRNKFLFFLCLLAMACIFCSEKSLAEAREYDKDARFFLIKAMELLPKDTSVYHFSHGPLPPFAGIAKEDVAFYAALSKESVETQVDVLRKLGFGGVFLDKKEHGDRGDFLEQELAVYLETQPEMIGEHGRLVFFRMPPSEFLTYPAFSSTEMMMASGFFVDELGERYKPSLARGFDFKGKGTYSLFIDELHGLSVEEPWGRWSDADVAPYVRFIFSEPLPERFLMELEAWAFGPNVGEELLISVGGRVRSLKIPAESFKVLLQIEAGERPGRSIDFLPPKPASPKELGMSEDVRRLGIGFISMRIIEHE